MTDLPIDTIDSDASTARPDDDRTPAERRRDRGITQPMDDLDCHDCQSPISANTGLGCNGWRYRGGTCPNCSFADAAYVEVDPEGPTDAMRQKMEREQRNPQAQSCFQAAMFLDDVPAGRYEVRRVTSHTVQVLLPDGIDQEARHALADRYKDATKTSGTRTWYVQSFPDRINLVDFQFGQKDEGEHERVASSYAGP